MGPPIRLTGSRVLVDKVLSSTVSIIVVDGHHGTVNGQLLKVGAAVTVDLRVKVREDATLQQGVFGKVDASHNVARLELRPRGLAWQSSSSRPILGHVRFATTHHDLLRLGKVVDGVYIKPHHSHLLQGHELFRYHLGCIENVEAKFKGLVFAHDLYVELPLGKVAGLDGVPEILAMEVGVAASNVLCLVPDQAGLALLRLPVPLDELGLALVVDEAKGVNAEAVLVATLVSIQPGLATVGGLECARLQMDIPCA